MNSKWYVSTLFFVLAFLGVSLKQSSTPNQEIVVQFNNNGVTQDEALNALAIVKEQLQEIGVENIRVQESANGTLKITYYSEIDVAGIKELFAKDKNLELGYTLYSHNEEDPGVPPLTYSSNYKLNVSEIQKGQDLASDFEGFLFESKSVTTRYINADVYFSHSEVDIWEKNRLEKVAFELHSNQALLIDNSSHNIPEVRAGPLA